MTPRLAQTVYTVGAVVLMTGVFGGCALGARPTIPLKWIHQAESGVTFTVLAAHPEQYRNKVIILGGTPIAEVHAGDRLWIQMRNRPLETDYHPHLPLVHGGTEDGHYWVLIDRRDFASTVHRWARVTVVGKVIAPPSLEITEFGDAPGPVLTALYLQGWPVHEVQAESWEAHRDPQYLDPRGMADSFHRACWICRSPYGGE